MKLTAVTAGAQHTCALTTGGGVQCWGDDSNGQLGNNSTTDSSVPVAVSGLSTGVTAISAGSNHTCALTTAGGVQCWGANGNGQLGNGSTTDSSVPVPVTGLSGVTVISAGTHHTCALTAVGGVQCWGDDQDGELGNNSTTQSLVPVAVSGLSSGGTAVTAGDSFTCALTTGGAARCWGKSFYLQLGNSSQASSPVPVAVSGLSSGAAAIVAGGDHTCALTTASGVQCWGYDYFGQLGNGHTGWGSSSTPGAVSGLSSGVSAIAVGWSHSCALTTAGGVQCWGHNAFGELGNGSQTDSGVPVPVSGLSGEVAAIAAGVNGGSATHTCALTTAGAVQCWGSNGHGQLGNGSTLDSPVPVSVVEP